MLFPREMEIVTGFSDWESRRVRRAMPRANAVSDVKEGKVMEASSASMSLRSRCNE